jgi:TonB family protein
MIANILVIEYEPRSVQLVRTALTDSDYRLEIAGNLDDAVTRCAQFEPTVAIITSVLPNLKIEDAITQLRARAGLRATPFLILMSGYTGDDSADDAVRYGAQDILQRPFSADALRERVDHLVQSAPNPMATQAIPQEMLEALRRSAGLDGDEGQVTSDDLFGDILSDVEGGEQQPVKPPEPQPLPPEAPAAETSEAPPPSPKPEPEKGPTAPQPPASTPQQAPRGPVGSKPTPPSRAAVPSAPADSVDRALAEILERGKQAPPAAHPPADDDSVDKLLEDTLSGLEVGRAKKKAPPAKAPAAATDQPSRATPPPKPAAGTKPAAPRQEPTTAPAPSVPSQPPAARAPAPAEGPAMSTEAPRATPAAPRSQPELPPVPPPARAPTQIPGGETPAPRGAEFGQYVIEEHIATGGMADVYKARMMGMEGFQKTVAIKRILSNLTDSDEFVRMFIDEAKLAAQLNHDNIIQIFDLGKIDRSHYIAMEYIEGRDLRSILQDCRDRKLRMPIELALHIAILLASALDYAHKKQDFENRDLGLVHRDVSPQNVLISYDGNVKLCDFGIAKAASKASQTRAGALKGKLQYMSPEQAWGKDIDHRSDIFSLGLVLYEMLVSEKVFEGNSELSVLEQVRDPIIEAPSVKNPDIDPEIDRIVFQALTADREQRYQSALELQRDLERVMRAKNWSPDRKVLADFLRHLGHDRPPAVSQPAAPAVATAPPQRQDRAQPTVPPARAPRAIAPSEGEVAATQRPAVPPDMIMPDSELEAALSATEQPPPVAGSYDLDASDSTFTSAARGGGSGRFLWLLIAAVVVLAAAVGGWWFLFGKQAAPPTGAGQPPAVVAPTETPSPEPTVGLMSDDELLERAREVAAAEIVRQEEELRQRLEQEFPTPTRIPPTSTPTETATPEPTATRTPTPRPPTATRPPPTATTVPSTPTPALREGDLVAAGPDVTPPVLIFREPLKYPPGAQLKGIEGIVEVQALIGINGAVEEVRVINVEPKNVGFEEATIEAVSKSRYKPASKNGVRVRIWMTVRVPFRLR